MSKNEIIINKLKALARLMFPDGSGEVYLYGSRANGTAHNGSDWDLLVLTDDSRSTSDNFVTFAMPFAEIGWQYGEQITPLHYTRSQWLAEKATAFFHNVTTSSIRLQDSYKEMSNKEILTILKERMNSFMPKDAEVMLYGSRARGDYSDASDWDLLVLLNRPGRVSIEELGRISYPFYDLGAELDIEINPVIYTRDDWQRRSHTPFYAHATQDSIHLWG